MLTRSLGPAASCQVYCLVLAFCHDLGLVMVQRAQHAAPLRKWKNQNML